MTSADYSRIDDLIALALDEDIATGDVTSLATVPMDRQAKGIFTAKETGILAGADVATRVFTAVDPSLKVVWKIADGSKLEKGDVAGTVTGSARAILTAERTALNILQRMSGIATATHAMAQAAKPALILDTRKTAPGMRVLDKWAVRLGGGTNHRTGLYDMILIKDNHIVAAGGVRAAIDAAHRYRTEYNPDLLIEIEAATIDQVVQVLDSEPVDWILLDNMVSVAADGTIDVSRLREMVELIDGRILTEASGNVTLDTVAAIASAGVNAISSGALTHSVHALDLSLGVELV